MADHIDNKIEQTRWVEFCDMVSDGNRGRSVSVEVVDDEIGEVMPVKNAPFFSLTCDPKGKGNDIMVETGKTEVSYAHTVNSPTEVWESQDENGKLVALSIKGAGGDQTIVNFL